MRCVYYVCIYTVYLSLDSEEEIVASTSNPADKPDAVIQELPEGFFDDPKLDAKVSVS